MLSILARILFIMAYGVLGRDRLHNCLRLHDTGFVMSHLRLFVRPLFVLLCHYCSLALQCYRAIAFFITLIVYRFNSTRRLATITTDNDRPSQPLLVRKDPRDPS
jgi:hypothetical protein